MIAIATIDELRETRRRLAEQAGLDVKRYAALLQAGSGKRPSGTCVAAPLLPQPTPARLPVTPFGTTGRNP